MRAAPHAGDKWISLVCLWITTYVTIWCLLYHLLHIVLFRKESPAFNARLLSSVQSLTVTSLAYSMWKDDMRLLLTPGTPMTDKQADVLAAILGYIIVDFVWCLSHHCEPGIMKVHHSLCILLVVLALTRANCGPELIFTYAVNQVSNLFLQLRWFLRYHDFDCDLMECLFIVVFFCEKIWLTLFVSTVKSPAVTFEFKLCLIAHCVVGYIFCFNVLVILIWPKLRRKFHPDSIQKQPPATSTLSFDQYERLDEESPHEDRPRDKLHEDKRRSALSRGVQV